MQVKNLLHTLFRGLFQRDKLKEPYEIEQRNSNAEKEVKSVGKNIR